MNIRNAQEQDTEQIEKIFDLYWNDNFRDNLSDKLEKYLRHNTQLQQENFELLVVEDGDEIVGVAAMRAAPPHMSRYAKTDNPVEFYVAAVKYKKRGIGTLLKDERLKRALKQGYTEALLFGGETHSESWGFYDKYGVRVSEMNAPNGEKGYIWSLPIK